MYNAYGYTSNHGIYKASDYHDYSGTLNRSRCKLSSNKWHFFNSGRVEKDFISNDELKALVAKHPVGAAMNTDYKTFPFY